MGCQTDGSVISDRFKIISWSWTDCVTSCHDYLILIFRLTVVSLTFETQNKSYSKDQNDASFYPDGFNIY